MGSAANNQAVRPYPNCEQLREAFRAGIEDGLKRAATMWPKKPEPPKK